MPELDPLVEQQLAELPDADWRALVARVREPEDPKAAAASALRSHVRRNTITVTRSEK
jgi:hypothetical protein